VRIPEVYLGEENIGSQIGFVVDDLKDEGDFEAFWALRGSVLEDAFDFQHRRFCWER
jgi:hypothetical protein